MLLEETGLGGTVEGMKADEECRQVQKEQLSIQRSSAGLLKKQAIVEGKLKTQAAEVNATRRK